MKTNEISLMNKLRILDSASSAWIRIEETFDGFKVSHGRFEVLLRPSHGPSLPLDRRYADIVFKTVFGWAGTAIQHIGLTIVQINDLYEDEEEDHTGEELYEEGEE